MKLSLNNLHIDDRRELLKQYILFCIRDSALSWSDLASPLFYDKLLKILSKDGKVILQELGKRGGAGLLQVGANVLAQLAENVVRRK